DDDAAVDLAASGAQRLELDLAVAHQDAVAFFDDAVESAVSDGHERAAADDVAARQRDAPAAPELRLPARHFADADLRPVEILQDSDVAVEPPRDAPDALDHGRVKAIIAVAEVEARDVHARLDQRAQGFFRLARRAYGADDFCAAH